MRKALMWAGGMVGAVAIFGPADAAVWYVHPDSPLNTVQAGLGSCSNGDTVLVAAGTYCENIVWPNTQGIHLISQSGPEKTVLDGAGNGSVVTIGGEVDPNTVVKGFTIRNGNGELGGGIYCHCTSPRITGNVITENRAIAGGGIFVLLDGSGPAISGNAISGNRASGWGSGVACCERSSRFAESCMQLPEDGTALRLLDDSCCPLVHNGVDGSNASEVANANSPAQIDAKHNWWGDSNGPGGVGPGAGDEVSESVDYEPWLSAPIPAGLQGLSSEVLLGSVR